MIKAVFEIEFTHSARHDLKALRKFEQQIVVDGIYEQLQFEPNVETANRKRLHPNDTADWELRLRKYRVFYDLEEQVKMVTIRAVGLKTGNALYIRGERRLL